MILDIISEIQNSFQYVHPSVSFLFGKDKLDSPLPDTRIIWYPTNDNFTPSRHPGMNSKQMMSREVGLNFDIFSRSLNSIDNIINDLGVAIYEKIGEPSIINFSGVWLDLGEEEQQGMGYRLSITIDCVIHKRPLATVTIGSLDKGVKIEGSSEIITP